MPRCSNGGVVHADGSVTYDPCQRAAKQIYVRVGRAGTLTPVEGWGHCPIHGPVPL